MKYRIFPGWWQVVAVMVAQAVGSACVYTAYSVLAVQFRAAFEPSTMVLMLSITAVTLASGIISPPAGAAVDRFSVRGLMLTGAGMLAAGFLLLSVATSMFQVLVIYTVFFSAGVVLLGPLAATALLARWFTRRRGMAMGIAASSTAIGGLLIPPLLQGLIDAYTWQIALRIFAAIIVLVTVPVIALLVVDRPADRGLFADGDHEPVQNVSSTAVVKSITLREALRAPAFWIIAIAIGAIFAGPTAISSNLLPFVIEKGITASTGAYLLSIMAGANFAGKLLCAAVVDRIDIRLALAIVLSGLGLASVACLLGDTYTGLAVAVFMVGIFGGAGLPLWGVILARIYGAQFIGQMMGLMTFIMMPITLLAPPLFGLAFDKTGSYNAGFIGYLVLLAGVLLLLVMLRVTQPMVVPAKEQA